MAGASKRNERSGACGAERVERRAVNGDRTQSGCVRLTRRQAGTERSGTARVAALQSKSGKGRGEQMSGLGEAVAVGVVLGVVIGAGAALLGVFVGLRAVRRELVERGGGGIGH